MSEELIRLVIDTDPGVDDAHAIMLAFGHPRARVEAITTVAGNVGLEATTANACTILDVLGVAPEATPIFAGCPVHCSVGPSTRPKSTARTGWATAISPVPLGGSKTSNVLLLDILY